MWMLIVAGAAGVFLLVYVAGLMVPESHVATVAADYRVQPDAIYAVISDPSKFMKWRTGLTRVDVEGDRITEHSSFGPMHYRFGERVPGRRLTTEDAGGRERGFTGSWTFEIEPVANGSRLTITERGRVFNPVFRLLARFVFGYEGTMRQYHKDLAKRLGV